MGIITMHLVCFSKIYRSREDDFLKLNTLLLYDHVTVYSPTLGPEPRVMHFTIFLDGFMAFSFFPTCCESGQEDFLKTLYIWPRL